MNKNKVCDLFKFLRCSKWARSKCAYLRLNETGKTALQDILIWFLPNVILKRILMTKRDILYNFKEVLFENCYGFDDSLWYGTSPDGHKNCFFFLPEWRLRISLYGPTRRFRHLQCTKDYMLMYRRSDHIELVGYSDSN